MEKQPNHTFPNQQKSPLDVAADVFVFAPVGLAIELGKQLPEFARQGRAHLQGPLTAAKFMGNIAAMQGRREFGDKVRKAGETLFGDQGAAPSTSYSAPRERADLPIAGYDTLSATQIVSHLGGLSDADLGRIQAYEESNRARKTVLSRIEQLLAT